MGLLDIFRRKPKPISNDEALARFDALGPQPGGRDYEGWARRQRAMAQIAKDAGDPRWAAAFEHNAELADNLAAMKKKLETPDGRNCRHGYRNWRLCSSCNSD